MQWLSWELFKVYNHWKDLKNLFEELCIDYLIKKYQENKNDVVVIDPNNPWIETHPLNNWSLWVQSKFITDNSSFKSQIENSLVKNKMLHYKKLKTILAISNVDFSVNTRSSLPLCIKWYRNREIKICYINGKTFLRELKKMNFTIYNIIIFEKIIFDDFLKINKLSIMTIVKIELIKK